MSFWNPDPRKAYFELLNKEFNQVLSSLRILLQEAGVNSPNHGASTEEREKLHSEINEIITKIKNVEKVITEIKERD